MEAKIIVAGDAVVSLKRNNEVAPNMVDQRLTEIIQGSAYSFVNFEAPVRTKYSKAIHKTGPNLSQSAKVIDALKDVGFSCFTLANNHFRDYGHDAIENTITLLKAKDIDYLGGGENLSEASKILYKRLNGINIAFINVCEQEWSIATDQRAGSNPVQALTQYYQIQEAKQLSDFVILIHHGGVEHYNLPSPELKQLHRFFIDAGADAVINHHQHCFSGFETYKGKPIFYGLGNFLFDSPRKCNDSWNYGYLVELTLDNETKEVAFEIHPYEQCNDKFGVYYRSDLKAFEEEIERLNAIIADDTLLRNSWSDYMSNHRSFYTQAISPYRLRIFNKLFRMKLLPSFISKFQLSYIYDVISCDSHRTRFLDFLEHKISK